jgi:hypothetical protein
MLLITEIFNDDVATLSEATEGGKKKVVKEEAPVVVAAVEPATEDVVVDTVHSGTAPLGLSVVISARLP